MIFSTVLRLDLSHLDSNNRFKSFDRPPLSYFDRLLHIGLTTLFGLLLFPVLPTVRLVPPLNSST